MLVLFSPKESLKWTLLCYKIANFKLGIVQGGKSGDVDESRCGGPTVSADEVEHHWARLSGENKNFISEVSLVTLAAFINKIQRSKYRGRVW